MKLETLKWRCQFWCRYSMCMLRVLDIMRNLKKIFGTLFRNSTHTSIWAVDRVACCKRFQCDEKAGVMPLRHKYSRDVRLSGWSFRSISVYDKRNVLKRLRCRATMVKWTFLYVEIRFRLAPQYRHLPNVSLVCTRQDYVRISPDCYLCYNTIVSNGVTRGSPGK